MPGHGCRVKALGEIAIRCRDVAAMARFYGDVVSLERLEGNHHNDLVFFKIADGYAGHTAILALFPAEPGGDVGTGPVSSLHHIALTVAWQDQALITSHFDEIGQDYWIEEFAWVSWRGVFTRDPDGNAVEFVAHDPAVSARKP
jgi:catechol 2,3-dioxygenase-like lactoylglutathione lyase family enzyme